MFNSYFDSAKALVILSIVFAGAANGETLLATRTHHTLLAGGGLATCSSVAVENCTTNPFSDEQKRRSMFQLSTENINKFTRLNVFRDLPESQKAHFYSIFKARSTINVADSNVEHAAYSELAGAVMAWEDFAVLFDTATVSEFVTELDDPIFFALKDSFEIPIVDRNGKRLRERVSMEHNRNKTILDVFQSFVTHAALLQPAQAGAEQQKKPLIAVVTASLRDPFAVADFYLNVFQHTGANVIWLPLDRSFQVARDLERKFQMGCAQLPQIRQQYHLYYREDIYPDLARVQQEFCQHPEKLHAILEQIDGIFFNGGDQSLMLNALITPQQEVSPELAIIQRRHAAGNLMVGGTSAGTAVQAGGDVFGRPVPMLSNGHSRRAMQRGAFGTPAPSNRCITAHNCRPGLLPDDLTYRAAGGAGFFQLGLLDTHFSEKDRETRLAVFTATARQRLAFGVDEATALLLNRDQEGSTHLQVIGENGVFMLDFESGQATKRNKAIRRKPTPEAKLARTDRTFVEVAAVAHYLNSGSEAIFNAVHESWHFNLAGSLMQRKHKLPMLKLGKWRDVTRSHCGTKEQIHWQQFDNHYQLLPDVDTQFYMNALVAPSAQISNKTVRQHCSYVNLPFVISYMSL